VPHTHYCLPHRKSNWDPGEISHWDPSYIPLGSRWDPGEISHCTGIPVDYPTGIPVISHWDLWEIFHWLLIVADFVFAQCPPWWPNCELDRAQFRKEKRCTHIKYQKKIKLSTGRRSIFVFHDVPPIGLKNQSNQKIVWYIVCHCQ
jgi:hypothetical protein